MPTISNSNRYASRRIIVTTKEKALLYDNIYLSLSTCDVRRVIGGLIVSDPYNPLGLCASASGQHHHSQNHTSQEQSPFFYSFHGFFSLSLLLAVRLPTSGPPGSHGVTGGVYKARERIHRGEIHEKVLIEKSIPFLF